MVASAEIAPLAATGDPEDLEVGVELPLVRLEACCGLQGRALGARIDLSGLLASAVQAIAADPAPEIDRDFLISRRSA